jgi:glyoxylase-like metal-dependent hydrolase (beta-lactamase superfamily II)
VQAFLVEHPRAGPLLIDTGFHPSVAVDPKQNLGRIGTLVFRGIEMEASQAVPAQLRAKGIEPASVRYVFMTHFHIDHASAMSEFPDATFAFSAREWEAANEQGELHGYRRRQWDHGFDYRTLDFEGSDADSVATFGRGLDLLGDGSVRAVFTPGHTLGHVSYVLRLESREALVAGDAIYSRRALGEGVLPYRVEDEHLFRRSLREIQLYARERPEAVVIPGHDMDALRALGPVL